jgi:dihydroorotate dehydrogenase
VKPYSLRALRTLRSYLPASIPLIGCGGVSSGADALEYARAGASLVQIYTSFGYDGAGACRRIKDQLVDELKKEGTTWNQVVKGAEERLSLRDGEREIISKLVLEAQELKRSLDKLEHELDNRKPRAQLP